MVITMLALLPFTELDDSSKDVECFEAMSTYKNNHNASMHWYNYNYTTKMYYIFATNIMAVWTQS